MQKTQVWSLGQEDSLEKEMVTSPVFLPGKSHGQRSLAGYSPWDHRVRHNLATEHACTHSQNSCVSTSFFLPGRPKFMKAGFPESVSFPSCITLGKLLDIPCPIFFNYKTDMVIIRPNYGVALRLKWAIPGKYLERLLLNNQSTKLCPTLLQPHGL